MGTLKVARILQPMRRIGVCFGDLFQVLRLFPQALRLLFSCITLVPLFPLAIGAPIDVLIVFSVDVTVGHWGTPYYWQITSPARAPRPESPAPSTACGE